MKDKQVENCQVLLQQRDQKVEKLEGEVLEKKKGLLEKVKGFFAGKKG